MPVDVLTLVPEGEQGAEEFVHPDALGVRKTSTSRFVEVTQSGTDSVVKVHRWNGKRGWTSAIAELPRGRGRPAVYCPFCGRKGFYAHTDRYRYFRHADGEQDCVESHLESVRHRRAKLLLVEGLRRAREEGLPILWTRSCDACARPEISELLPAGHWDGEDDEVRYTAGTTLVVFDAAAQKHGKPALGLEVRASHAVDGDKLDAVEAAGVPLVEFLVDRLVDDQGQATWDGTVPLPPAFVWRVSGLSCPYRCEACLRPPVELPPEPVEDPVWEMLRQASRRIRAYGLKVTSTCHRCQRPHALPFLGRGAAPAKDSEHPQRVTFQGRKGQVHLQIGGETGAVASSPVVLLSRPQLESVAEGPYEPCVAPSQIHGWTPPPTPTVCPACRRPSATAEEIDQLWVQARDSGPGGLPRLKAVLESKLGLPDGALAALDKPFASQMEQRPEDFQHEADLSSLAWRGLRGSTSGIALVEALLDRKLDGTWANLDELLPAPHRLLFEAMDKGEIVAPEVLVLADKVMFGLGLEDDAQLARERAWVLEALLDHCGWGHTAWGKGQKALARRAFKRIKEHHDEAHVPRLDTQAWTARALEDGILRRVSEGARALLATRRHVKESQYLARSLLIGGCCSFEVDDGLYSDVPLDPVQAKAVSKAVASGLTAVTGGAGTGKTTVVRAVLQTLSESLAVVAAPTGKAAERLRSALDGVEQLRGAYTVAKLLAKPKLLLGAQVLVVDEAGFLDLRTAARLFWLVRKLGEKGPSRVVLVGDPNQLSSIGPGAVLRDVLDARGASGHVLPQEVLTTGFRSGQQLQSFSKSVLAGTPDFDLIDHWDVHDDEVANAVLQFTGRLGTLDGVQVIAPTRALVDTLNKGMQRRWNPKGQALGRTRLRDGDRVMCTENHYDDPVILNGEQGRMRVIQGEDGLWFSLNIDGEDRGPFDYVEHTSFDLAYAVTIHKAQGSEWDTVVVAVPSTRFFDRKMLYTAATRAKRRLVLVGPRRAVIDAARRQRERETLLRTLLESQASSFGEKVIRKAEAGGRSPHDAVQSAEPPLAAESWPGPYAAARR